MLVLYCIKNQAKNYSLGNFLLVREQHMKKKMVLIGGLYKVQKRAIMLLDQDFYKHLGMIKSSEVGTWVKNGK